MKKQTKNNRKEWRMFSGLAKHASQAWLAALLLGVSLFTGGSSMMTVQAQEETQVTGVVMVAQQELEMKAEPDASAETLHTFGESDNVFVTGESAGGWYPVRYQDMTGYVAVSGLTQLDVSVEALDEEFAVREQEGKILVEEVERQRDEARRSKIWGTVIVVLVIAIFATGIVSTVKSKRKAEGRA